LIFKIKIKLPLIIPIKAALCSFFLSYMDVRFRVFKGIYFLPLTAQRKGQGQRTYPSYEHGQHQNRF
jgi:hypothetical protein